MMVPRAANTTFRLLGSLRVRVGERDIPIRGSRLGAVLAALLLNGNQTVTVAQLGRAIWMEPPRAAASNIRTYIAQLRAALAAAGEPSSRLVTDPAGYRLTVRRGELDVWRFEELAEAGEFAVEDGNPADAMRSLEHALQLWHGEPFGGLSAGPLLHAYATQLDDRRIAVIERWADAAMAAGQAERAARELAPLVKAYPLRERLWGSLMLALYRSGRQAEALSAYQDLYRLFNEELAISPSEPLQRLNRQIITGDLIGVPRDQPLRPPGTPNDLPRDLPSFVGRAAELNRIVDALVAAAHGPAVVGVHGPAGVGKSALAVRAAHAVAASFPDGQLYADLDVTDDGLAMVTPREVLVRFLRSLGVAAGDVPADVAGAAATFRSLVAGRRLLVVLDNVVDPAHVVDLMPASAGCGVLLTSRQMLATVDATHVDLGPLGIGEAVQLLDRTIGGRRVAAEPQAAAEIGRWCGGYPLAVRLAGARLASRTDWLLTDFAARLADAERRLDELRYGGLDLRTRILSSYHRLTLGSRHGDALAAQVFRILGGLRTCDVRSAAVAVLLDRPEPVARAALDRLVELRLVDAVDDDRYRIPDLVRLCAAEQARAVRRMCAPDAGPFLRSEDFEAKQLVRTP